MYDIVVLGGGPAGYTAAMYAGRANLSVLLIESIAPGGQMGQTEWVDNYPGFPEGINGFDLAQRMKAQAERFGATTHLETVTKVSLQGAVKHVETNVGTYEARCIIVATGAAPRKLGVQGEAVLAGKGVSYCATCDGNFFRNKIVAVIGGGDTAAADALSLSKLAKKVYVIHRRDKLRASKAYLQPLAQRTNIEFLWNTRITHVLGESHVTGLALSRQNGVEDVLPVDGVFVAIGTVPNSELFSAQLVCDSNHYVLAGDNTKTNLDGVFAIGDVRQKPLRQIATAVSDGAVSAYMAEAYLNEQ